MERARRSARLVGNWEPPYTSYERTWLFGCGASHTDCSAVCKVKRNPVKQGLENRKRCIHGAILFLIAVMALILGADSGWAKPQQNSLHAKLPTAPGRLDTLGKVSFPTSASPRLQSQIEEGLALLHSFQYWQAESRFAEVSKQEPQCAMANWGKAMSLFEQLWYWPDAKTFAEV